VYKHVDRRAPGVILDDFRRSFRTPIWEEDLNLRSGRPLAASGPRPTGKHGARRGERGNAVVGGPTSRILDSDKRPVDSPG
jgi:hypothetical protein